MSSTLSVLVVEDNEQTAEALVLLLNNGLGIRQVRETRSAEEALEVAGRERFHLILSDYQLEGMDGVALLDALRKGGNEVPFLLLTGVPDKGGILRVIQHAKAEVLGKPFQISELTEAMNRLLAA